MFGYKVISDSVHGNMDIPPLCIKVIDTPEFQRLRYIKQLGLVHFVYPSAAHSRFEHSLGVCYLAGLMIDQLRKNNPHIEITDKEKLCVQLAGLCHDIGHGPFSHLWESFLKRKGEKWKHEEQSIKMFRYLLSQNDSLMKDFEDNGLKEKEIDFIVDLIRGEGQPLVPKKEFLFQVVNNKMNDIDVDKWDYFLRDGLHLNFKIPYDYTRTIKNIRIMPIEEDGNKCVLVFKVNEAYDIYEMFNVRAKIHAAANQHRVVLVLSRMLLDALCAADSHFLGSTDLSKAHLSPKIWSKLTDNLLLDMLYSENKNMSESQNIIKDILKRRLYKFITFQKVDIDDPDKIDKLENDLKEKFPGLGLVASHCLFSFTSMNKDPFSKIYFYNKRDTSTLIKKKWNEVELFRSEQDPDPRPHSKIYLYSKELNISKKNADDVKSYFQNWFN